MPRENEKIGLSDFVILEIKDILKFFSYPYRAKRGARGEAASARREAITRR